MKMFVKPKRTYLHRDTVDFRKSIDGLVAIVEGEFERDAYTAALFLFCNKTKDKLKLVYWDKTGGCFVVQASWKTKVQMATVISPPLMEAICRISVV